MSYEEIKYRVAEGIATITLYRPQKLNAFTARMGAELIDAFSCADEDDGVRAIVVTGAGGAFCAGADLSGGSDTFNFARASTMEEHRDGGGRVALRIFESKKPVIAAINGPAVGVGVTMTLPMDVRIASSGARFGFVFTRRGVVPEACSSWFLPRVVGISRACEWILSGRVFGAAEALAGGLVSQVLPADKLLSSAYALARDIAENTSAVSVALARQMLWRMLGADHPMEAHRIDSKGIFCMGASPDAAEGIASFREKRKPHFPMRVSRDLPPYYPWWPERPFR